MNNNVINNINGIDRNFIIDCINDLDDKPYQNEEQFRDALVKKIRETLKGLFVSVDGAAWYSSKINSKIERKNIDIVIFDKEGNYVAIELKYHTRALNTAELKNFQNSNKRPCFLYNDLNGGIVRIAAKGDNTGVRYEFIKDIHRLELLYKKDIQLYDNHVKYKNMKNGFAIIVTNDTNIKSQKFNQKPNKLYNSVCIGDNTWIEQECYGTESRTHYNHNYDICLEPNFNQKSFPGKSKYECNWQTNPFYADPKNKNNPDFEYLIIEV